MIKRLLKAITVTAYIFTMCFLAMMGVKFILAYISVKIVLLALLVALFAALTAFFYLTQGK
jgi:hypothetical protein